MTAIGLTTRDVARELARRYSTMTHDELDVLESILVPMKFQKGEVILKEHPPALFHTIPLHQAT